VNNIRKFILLPREERALFLEAVLLLYLSKVLLFLPFRFCIKCLKTSHEMTTDVDTIQLKKIRYAVSRANKLAFWKNICLVKSFAARLMLQRRGIASIMQLGLQIRNGKELFAHAWLVSGEFQVTPKGMTDYKKIYSI
jgi:hypothetical protein